jgi:uncharacterized protein (DUF2252 family)
MRSFLIALALAAPVSAVAATPNYTNPMSSAHHQAERVVYMTFVNYTSQDREVVIGNEKYKIQYHSVAHVQAPVGSPVFVYSETNSKLNGQELMRVSENDKDTSVFLK